MPQWVQLPPNLLPEKHTLRKSIYSTDYSSKRPGFQIHLQRRRGAHHSHHPHPPKDPDRKTMRARQTGTYISFKQDLERALVAAEGTKQLVKRPQITTPCRTPPSAAPPVEHAVIEKFLKPSLDKVKQAWMGETHAVKRDRDRTYGMAGKRLDLQRKADKKETKQPELPGFKNWLHSSNEYEKAVVHNFIDSISKATDRPAGKTEGPKEKGGKTKARFANEYYYKQRAKSACSHRTTERSQLPPRPHSVEAVRHGDEAAEESDEEEHGTDYAPAHAHHTEGKCEFCDYMRVKKLLEDLDRLGASGIGETTISHLLRPRVPQPYPTYEDYDYIHDNSFFSSTIAKDRGYFIIAPDWVSERKGVPPPRYRYY